MGKGRKGMENKHTWLTKTTQNTLVVGSIVYFVR